VVNKYYEPGAKRSERVDDLFSAVARRYDLLNDLQSFGWHRRWKARLVQLAQSRPGDRALDLCCGTGDVALRLAHRGLKVTGVDFSEPMLARARLRVAQEPLPSQRINRSQGEVDWLRADAQRLPFPDNSYDIVTVAYGLRNLADWASGLDEMWRVIKPGGCVLVLDFGKPANPIWRKIYFAYLRCIVPFLGWIFCGDAQAYAYILDSLRHYPAQAGVTRKFQDLGGHPIQELNLLGGAMSIHCAIKPTAE